MRIAVCASKLAIFAINGVMICFGFLLIMAVAGIYYVVLLPQRPHSKLRDLLEAAGGLFILANIALSYYLCVSVPPGFPPLANEVEQAIENGEFYDKYSIELPFTTCRKCKRVRVDGTHHCSMCGRCVLGMDHHCPWLGQCVGKGNYVHFIQLISWLTLGAFMGVYLYAPVVFPYMIGRRTALHFISRLKLQLIMFAGLLSFCIGLTVGGLALFHYWLLCKGMSTIDFRTVSTVTLSGCSLRRFREVMGDGPLIFTLSPFYTQRPKKAKKRYSPIVHRRRSLIHPS